MTKKVGRISFSEVAYNLDIEIMRLYPGNMGIETIKLKLWQIFSHSAER